MTPSVSIATLASAGPGGKHFVFKRVGGPLAKHLLGDRDFEPGIPPRHRSLAVLSLESEQLGGFLIEHEVSGERLLARTSFLLGASPPAKPCFCLSFVDTTSGGNGIDLLSLLYHNEFQHPIGCYLHGKGIFIHYSTKTPDASLRFLKSESIDAMLLDLARLDQSDFLAKSVREGPLGHALVLGFNHSFGHAHWNDVLGLQHRQSLIQAGLLRPLASLVVSGPSLWLRRSLLSTLPCKSFEHAPACAEWTLKQRIAVHLPIGFHVDAGYEKFWRHTVSNQADVNFRTFLDSWLDSRHPIVLLSLRFNEQKRSTWVGRSAQLPELMEKIVSDHPGTAFMLDGLTRYSDELAADNHNAGESEIFDTLSRRFHVLRLHGRALQDKIYAYSHVHYCLGQFGSGTLLPAYAFTVPTINVCNDTTIVDVYGAKDFITNLAKPSRTPLTRFLPTSHVTQNEDGFFLNIDTAYSFIRSDLQAAIDGSLSLQLEPNQP